MHVNELSILLYRVEAHINESESLRKRKNSLPAKEYNDRLAIQLALLSKDSSQLTGSVMVEAASYSEIVVVRAHANKVSFRLGQELAELVALTEVPSKQQQLILAIRYGHEELATISCSLNQHLNQAFDYEPTEATQSIIQDVSPLIAAIIKGNSHIIKTIFSEYTRWKTDLNFTSQNETTKNLGYGTPVQAAITQSNAEFIQRWIQEQLPVTPEDINLAINKNRVIIVETLLAANPVFESTTAMLKIAIDHSSARVFALLQQRLPASQRNEKPEGIDELTYALVRGDLKAIKRLKAGKPLSGAELELATQFGQLEVLRTYMTNVNHVNATTKKSLLMIAIEAESLPVIQFLMNKGANALLTDNDGKTILNYIDQTTDKKIAATIKIYFNQSQPEPDDDLTKNPLYKDITSSRELFERLLREVKESVKTSYEAYLNEKDKDSAPYPLFLTTRKLCDRLERLLYRLNSQDKEIAYMQLNRVLYACQKAIGYPSDKNNKQLIQAATAQTVDISNPLLQQMTYAMYGLAFVVLAMGILACIPTLQGNVFLSLLLALKLKTFATSLITMATQLSFVPQNAVMGTIGIGGGFAVAGLTRASAHFFGPKRVERLAQDTVDTIKKEAPPKIGISQP